MTLATAARPRDDDLDLAALDVADADAFDWPLFGLKDDVRPAVARAVEAGVPFALATLAAVQGGAPRAVGAQMFAAADGALCGYVSGGCVEADLALQMQAALADGRPRRVVYGEGGPADIALPCGSRIELWVERVGSTDPAARTLMALGAARRPALWLSGADGARACIDADADGAALPSALRTAWSLAQASPLGAAFAPAPACAAPMAMVRRFDPVVRLVVVGADPVALAVCRFSAEMGLETVLVRPKGPEAPPPLPTLTAYHRTAPGDAFAAIGLDAFTAVCVLTHDTGQEHEALMAALPSAAPYVGALGSRRRIPERRARLAAAGLAEEAMQRLRAPIGLPIGGKSPYEIALATLAEVVETMAATRQGVIVAG